MKFELDHLSVFERCSTRIVNEMMVQTVVPKMISVINYVELSSDEAY